VDLVLGEVVSAVGDGWIERDQSLAIKLLAAHTLSMEGEPERSKAIEAGRGVANAQSGSVSSMKVGDVSVTYAGRSSGNTGVGMGAISAEYQKTTYGQRYYELMRKNFPAVRAV
jgi:hypothetical protein